MSERPRVGGTAASCMGGLAGAVLCLGTLMGSVPLQAIPQAEHPRLVSAQTANCSLCHEDQLAGGLHVHAPVADDCTLCHEIEIGEDGTTVSLMEEEPALCLVCHDELQAAVDLELEVPHFPAADSCLTCHAVHASPEPKLLIGTTGELCGDCHDMESLGESHDGQVNAESQCASCHAVHGSDNSGMLLASRLHAPFEDASCSACHRPPFGSRVRLRARGERLCTACHGDEQVAPPEGGVLHPPVVGEQRTLGCISCHNPHMSDERALLVAGGNDLCGRCHAEIVEAAEGENGHYAAAEDCQSCHAPHVAEQAKLLIEPEGDLCATCHDVEDEDLVSAHLGADLGRLTCGSCHTPHGSGHPKLLAENLHEPVLDGCDLCHDGASNQFVESDTTEVCVMCHDDISEQAASASVPHDAMELGGCTDCHNPHASPQPKLVKTPGAGPCADCHDEKVAGADEVAHGVIDQVGCRACHAPHGGEREHLLRETGSRLCMSCHGLGADRSVDDPSSLLGRLGPELAPLLAAVQIPIGAGVEIGHPLEGHRALGVPTAEEIEQADSTWVDELTCLTCHDPHKGRSKTILRWDAVTSFDACIACHPK